MYIISILGVMVCAFLMLVCGQGGFSDLVHISRYFDLVSILLILVIVIPVLFTAGLWKDFAHSFRLALGKKQAKTLVSLKRAKEAVVLASRVSLGAGAFITLFSAVMVLFDADTGNMQYNMAVVILDLLYGFFIYLLLLPIRSRLEIKIIEFMHEDEQAEGK